MKSLSDALKGDPTRATCWKATLTDGTVIAATSLDRDIVFEGLTYLSTASYSASAIASAADLSPDNLELTGFLSSPQITDSDVRSGRWDYAAVELFEVNFTDLAAGRNLLRKGTLGQVRAGRSQFTAELRGIMQRLSRHIVRVTTKECTADLGDARCGVNLAPFTVAGAITAVTSNRLFTDVARTEADSWFTGGLLTFTSGLNTGLRMEIKRSTPAGLIELHQSLPFDVAVGDTYSMHAGCSKRFTEDCVGKFNNAVNFRGMPHLPLSKVYGGPASL